MNFLLEIKKSCNPNCNIVFRNFRGELVIALKVLRRIKPQTILTIRGEKPHETKTVCEIDHPECKITTDKTYKYAINFLKECFIVSELNINKKQLRVVFNDELKREDFLKALVSSKNSRGLNIILNSFVIFKGLGFSHSVFHRTPPYSRIQ